MFRRKRHWKVFFFDKKLYHLQGMEFLPEPPYSPDHVHTAHFSLFMTGFLRYKQSNRMEELYNVIWDSLDCKSAKGLGVGLWLRLSVGWGACKRMVPVVYSITLLRNIRIYLSTFSSKAARLLDHSSNLKLDWTRFSVPKRGGWVPSLPNIEQHPPPKLKFLQLKFLEAGA